MAEEKKTGGKGTKPKASKLKLLIWLGALLAVVAAGAVGGQVASGLLSPDSATAEDLVPGSDSEGVAEGEEPDVDPAKKYLYLDFDSITCTLDSEHRDRYVRATLTFKTFEPDMPDLSERLGKRRPDLKNALNIYFSNLKLRDAGGERNVNRIRRELMELCNEILWPESRGKIVEVLLTEFVIS